MMTEFEVGSDMMGRLRILVLTGQGEPEYLPGVAKAHAGPMWPYTRAAVEASESSRGTAKSDGAGLYWENLGEATRALAAVRKAAASQEGA